MNSTDRKVKIPKALHELHGCEASIFDLWVNYITGISVTILILYLASRLDLSLIKMILLGILALDLAGGVVSNFTSGTSKYYAGNRKLRIIFIAVHFVQPLLLSWIFPESAFSILAISSFSLLAAIVINNLSHYHLQKTLAPSLTVTGIILILMMGIDTLPLLIMMLLFVIKLALAFPVKWN